ncbi:MAG TPA: class F sortase [Trebonia sp.]|jgi:hypothetical protein|nr:class F sortase [Trebonia sp.]
MRKRWLAAIAGTGLAALIAGGSGLALSHHAHPAPGPRPAQAAAAASPSPATRPSPSGQSGQSAPAGQSGPLAQATFPTPTAPIVAQAQPAASKPPAPPVSLAIPRIAVSTQLITLGLTAQGTVQVPATTTVAGWYTRGARPGATGPAIILGHIDSTKGPGVFYRLSQLRSGDLVYVSRSDGSRVTFRVTAVQSYPKDQFPTQAVYGPTPDAELRLITCGGAFDFATGHYLSNIVVYATEAG